jgi:hypothetical protein
MPLHTPSLAAAAAVIALLLALSVWLASWRPRRDALPATGLGLLASAGAFACAAGVGWMPDWTSEVAAPVGQSVALSAYTWGLLRLHARAAPWQNLTVMPALMGVLMVFLADLPTARDLSHDAVLIVQCLVLLIWSQRLALEHGQMHRLLMLGAGLGLLMNMLHGGTVLLGITPTSEPLALTRAEAWRLASELVLAFVPACALLLMSREDREMALQRLALRDPLTGIANHPAIAERCVSEVEQARRSGSPLGVVLIEIDQLPSLRARQGQAMWSTKPCSTPPATWPSASAAPTAWAAMARTPSCCSCPTPPRPERAMCCAPCANPCWTPRPRALAPMCYR